MGTRNLTAVAIDNGYKVAQYCQWDGYPTGEGHTILEFFKTVDLDTFKRQVREKAFYGTSDEIDAAYAKFISNNGWMNTEQAEAFKKSEYGYLSRDTGAKVLEVIYNASDSVMLCDSIDFAKDSLFCEYAYVIDLNRDVLEIYAGFNTEPLEPSSRFYTDEPKDGEYYPVRLFKEYSLHDLPDDFHDLEAEMRNRYADDMDEE